MTQAIPALKGSPVLGCLPEFRKDRLGFLRRAVREGGELVRIPMPAGRKVYVVTAPDLAGEVLRSQAASFKKFVALDRHARPILGDGLVTSAGDVHKRQRKLIAPGLTKKEVGSYAETMARLTDDKLAGWRDGHEIDALEEMAGLTLNIATTTMFGTSFTGDASAIGRAVHEAADYIAYRLGSLIHLPLAWPLPRHTRLRRAVAALDRVVFELIAERRADPTPKSDILGMLLAARDDDGSGMHDQQVRDEVMTLFVAGHETTANALTWALDLLARHPDIAERLASEARAVLAGRAPRLEDLPALPYALQVFKETMRLYPPAYMVGREATTAVTLRGFELPAGATVIVSMYGMHRRDDLFPEPERFDPDRFAPEREQALPRGAYLPFADGPRVCIGNHFALMEGQLVLAHLAQHVRFERPTSPPVSPLPRVTLRPSRPIRLRVRRASVVS
jgi:cytochrome P450